jgi:hypothetical protein
MATSSTLLNKLSWNGLIIIFAIKTMMTDGSMYTDFSRQTFDDWEDLSFKDWKVPPSSPYPDIDEILAELYNYSFGESPLAVFDKNRNLIWERDTGAWEASGLPVP